jgi:hypothetical protein
MRQWCLKNNINVEDFFYRISKDVDFKITDEPNCFKVNLLPDTSKKESICRYIIPIVRVTAEQTKYSSKPGVDANLFFKNKEPIASNEARIISFSVLEPFLNCSENVNNLLCCFGIGYVTSLLIVGNRFLKQNSIPHAVLVFRPLLGALASCILLIIILSGGAVIWNEVAGIRGLSLGMIGVIGSLSCDKLHILTFSL